MGFMGLHQHKYPEPNGIIDNVILERPFGIKYVVLYYI